MAGDSFKWDANLYQESSRFQYKLGLMAIKRLQPLDSEIIMDIGCGNALVTIEIAKLIPPGEVVAIEYSKEMYQKANENIQQSKLKNIKILNMNAINIAFSNEFDAAFSNSAIHWISNLEKMYGLIYRALKNKGRMLIQTALREPNLLIRTILQTSQIKEFRKPLRKVRLPWRFCTVDENRALLEQNHFIDITIEPYRYSIKFENLYKLTNFCKAAALVPFLNALPLEMHDDFINRFRQTFLELNESGELKIEMNRVFISGRKE
jgi:trans-aconitate methyltransferase